MKISEMTVDQATEAMIRISNPMKNICDDDEAVELLDRFGKMKDTPLVKAIGKTIPDFCVYCLRKHRNDFYEIIGALGGISPGKVGEMNFKQVILLVKESYDDILRDFFTASANAEDKTGI